MKVIIKTKIHQNKSKDKVENIVLDFLGFTHNKASS